MAETTNNATRVLPGVLFKAQQSGVAYVQRFVPKEANLQFLSCGEYRLQPGSESVTFGHPEEEALLFMWRGAATVELGGACYDLANYDTLYVPRGAGFSLHNASAEPAVIIQCTAPATNVHPVFHSKFAEFSKREDRIRHLKKKEVYMMFDVSEGADKLVAGYTFYQPLQRAWPPHNHTDQEETYFFIKGHGSMEMYESPENAEVRAQRRRGRPGDHPVPQLPPGVLAGGPARVHLVHRRRALLGGRQEQGLHGGQR